MPDVIRTLMVVSNLKIADGVAKFAMTYYSHLDHSNIHMDFAIYDSENINEEYEKIIKENHSRIYKLPPVKEIKRHVTYCHKIFQRRKYDIVHDNSLINTLPLMREATRAGVAVRILHSHATKLGETKAKEIRNKTFLPLLKCYVNAHAACTDDAGKCMFGNEKYQVIPNVIHGERFIYDINKRDYIRNKYNVSDKKVILTAGRMAPQKNPFFAIDVINQIVRQNPQIVYWWVGDGPLKEEIQTYIGKLGCRNSIKLLGSKTNIEDYYMAADLLFLPSLFEGLGLVAVEAQATGLPCLISSTIPKDVDYTDIVSRMDLSADTDVWVEIMNENLSHKEEHREKYYNELLKSVFCDYNAGRVLADYYEHLLKK